MASLKTKISTPKWRECIGFYERVLGLVVVEKWDDPEDKGAILAFARGSEEAFLELYGNNETHDFSGVSLQFKVQSVAKFVGSLPDSITYEGPTARPWGSTYVYLRDPAGVGVVVFEGGL